MVFHACTTSGSIFTFDYGFKDPGYPGITKFICMIFTFFSYILNVKFKLMKNNFYHIIILAVLLISCDKKEFQVVVVPNPEYIPNAVFKSSEDLSSSKFSHLIEKYQLDTVLKKETDELKRILLLRNWIKSVIKIDDYNDPYPGGGFAEGILDAALEGSGFHCGHFMTVQNGIMNAYGYVTRTMGAGPGVEGGPDGHHGMNEIWLNSHGKWFLSDAKYDHHFEKNGLPLSALEVRDEYLKNKGRDVVLVKGPGRLPVERDEETGNTKEEFMQTYTWLEWHARNDYFTAWPDYDSPMIMYADSFFQENTWIWDGKPHWAYNTDFLVTETDRQKIEWTPNTIRSDVSLSDHSATIVLISDTPNLKEYQMKQPQQENWEPVENNSIEIPLKKAGFQALFRTVNLAGVAGPEHRIVIEYN